MKTVKKAQVGKKVSGPKKPIKQYSEIDAGRGDYSKPRTEKQQKQWEKDEEAMINYKGRPKMKSGGSLSPTKKSVGKTIGKLNKAKSGTSLGMKSVKAGFDKNPGVTRADIIVAGKGQAKKGAKIGAKKMMGGGKCKYGCK